ncbi:hypothetical protein PIROE2DRAFT_64776 [Piromyces sp. E2]|nr:hypothetical protein PIROE2DRAFT_64776 [Piromyces sp. E2]|eukprot:OUM57846.1 hypothetical protein PIROE2DRAFT_64776 [Piromyces sp. E2]
MGKRQFGFYTNFYKSEKKKVEFIEAHLGSASEWYYIFMSEKQREEPNSGLLLEELAKYFSTNIPDNLKLSRLLKLSHRWGNAVEFVTKFKLYSTQLAIPNVLQIRLFEERVNPLVKKKLMDLEPKNRTIENYSEMLITYDTERERHWDSEAQRGNFIPLILPKNKVGRNKNFGIRNVIIMIISRNPTTII